MIKNICSSISKNIIIIKEDIDYIFDEKYNDDDFE